MKNPSNTPETVITPQEFIKHAEQLAEPTLRDYTNEITGKQLLTEVPEKQDFLIEGLIPRTGLGTLAGGSDLGKSALLRQLAIFNCVGANMFLGFTLKPIHRSALIVSSEDGREAMAFLLSRQTVNNRADDLQRLRFIFDWDNLITEIDTRLTKNPADLVIMDCFADVFGGDLKDTQKIRLCLMEYQKLSAKHNCYFLFLHHTAKRTESLEPSKNNLLSGQGFEAKMRLVIELRADLMNPEYRHLCIVKGNYLPSSMKKESYVLKFAENDFNFQNTGERTPFELLAKKEDDGGKVKYQQAKELKDKGYTHEKIADAMGYKSRGSVTKLFDKGESNGW